MPAPARAFTVRHVQLLRALLAAVAAVMITFSPDHSAAIGLSVFGGFTAATALVLVLGATLASPRGERAPGVLLAVVSLLAAIASGVPAWRTDAFFFVVVISWAAASGIIEVLAGVRASRLERGRGRDGILVGAFGMVLAVALLLVSPDYALQYRVEGAGDLTLTGIIIGVGIFGGYVAIVAVFLGIAGLTPRPPSDPAGREDPAAREDSAPREDPAGREDPALLAEPAPLADAENGGRS